MDEFNNYYQDDATSNGFSCFTPRPPAVREREQLFEKVLTPSDVGKLNRLVIPKHHAEKHFPIGSSMILSSEKEKDARQSLILNFEDGSGKLWRFRYSYWSSSQSYVLTKGWSRFVKEKELVAGDVVLFEKETSGFSRFFIDFRRRTDVGAVELRPVFFPTPSTLYYNHHTNFYNGLDLGSLDHLPSFGHVEGRPAVILDSVPVVPGRTPATSKSVKLFGVDLEYPVSEDGEECSSSSSNHNFSTVVHHHLLPSPSTELMSDDLLNSSDLSLSLKSDN